VFENACVFDTAGLRYPKNSARPFRARMICVWASCSRVIFSQKSPFALTVHTFGVRGNLAPTVESMMLLRHPGYTLPSRRGEEILCRCFVGETMHKSVFLRQLWHAVREDFFPDGEGVEDFFGFSGVR
jgi:hypothetical protein